MEGEKREKRYGKRIKSENKKGKYIKSKQYNNLSNDIAIDATLRASLLRDKSLNIKKEDLREKIRNHGSKLSIALVIDLSGSMVNDEKLRQIKTILQKIISNVHINRDKLAVIGFKERNSEIIIPSTLRPSSFLNKLEKLAIGGTTPMASGIDKGLEVLKKDLKKEEYIPMIMVLSDGVTNVGLLKSENDKSFNHDSGLNLSFKNNNTNNPQDDVIDLAYKLKKLKIHTVIVNFEKDKNKGRSINKELAYHSGGKFYDLNNITSQNELSNTIINNILNYERENL
ncbi:VWA domain-containing protein [Methanobrevibacter sp. OttesenSCG-928-I08]|nr:VWA domain-containing protein [Methanobrevibacter sp. OttesenSCG-928-I08]